MALRYAWKGAVGANNGTSLADAWNTEAALSAGLAPGDELIWIGTVDGSGVPVQWGALTFAAIAGAIIRAYGVLVVRDCASGTNNGNVITTNGNGVLINPEGEGMLTVVSITSTTSFYNLAMNDTGNVCKNVYFIGIDNNTGQRASYGASYTDCVATGLGDLDFYIGSGEYARNCTVDNCTMGLAAFYADTDVASAFDCCVTGETGIGFQNAGAVAFDIYRRNSSGAHTTIFGASTFAFEAHTVGADHRFTLTNHRMTVGRSVLIADVAGTAAGVLNGTHVVKTVVDPDNFEIEQDTTGLTAADGNVTATQIDSSPSAVAPVFASASNRNHTITAAALLPGGASTGRLGATPALPAGRRDGARGANRAIGLAKSAGTYVTAWRYTLQNHPALAGYSAGGNATFDAANVEWDLTAGTSETVKTAAPGIDLGADRFIRFIAAYGRGDDDALANARHVLDSNNATTIQQMKMKIGEGVADPGDPATGNEVRMGVETGLTGQSIRVAATMRNDGV